MIAFAPAILFSLSKVIPPSRCFIPPESNCTASEICPNVISSIDLNAVNHFELCNAWNTTHRLRNDRSETSRSLNISTSGFDTQISSGLKNDSFVLYIFFCSHFERPFLCFLQCFGKQKIEMFSGRIQFLSISCSLHFKPLFAMSKFSFGQWRGGLTVRLHFHSSPLSSSFLLLLAQ